MPSTRFSKVIMRKHKNTKLDLNELALEKKLKEIREEFYGALVKPKEVKPPVIHGRNGKDGSVGPQGPAGLSGKDGQGFNWRSNWLESERYYPGDVVNYLGSTYVALQGSLGDYPNRIKNGWDLMASAGAGGARGPQGISGSDGLEGIVVVNTKEDLPTASSGVITLEAGQTYFFTGDIDLTGDRLETGGIVTIMGTSSETASVTSTGLTAGTPLLTSRYTLPVRFITFKDVDTGIYIDDNGGANAPLAVDWLGVNFNNVDNVGEIGTVDNFIYDTGAFLGSQNLIFTGTVGTVGLNNSLFQGDGSSSTIFDLQSTCVITRRFRTIYSSIVAFGSTVGYTIHGSATVPVEGFILDTINFAGGSTYVSGLTSGDNKSRWIECRGITNSSSISNYYMNGNTTATVVSTSGVAYKVAGTTTSSSITQKFTNTDNRATYNGALSRNFKVTAVLSVESGNNNQIGVYLAKNGSVLTDSEVYLTTNSGGRAEAGVVQALTNLDQGDYIEVFVENDTGTSNITVSDLNVSVESIS